MQTGLLFIKGAILNSVFHENRKEQNIKKILFSNVHFNLNIPLYLLKYFTQYHAEVIFARSNTDE